MRILFTLTHLILQDEICKSVSHVGGIDVILRCLDDSGMQGNSAAAKALCSLLSKVQKFHHT